VDLAILRQLQAPLGEATLADARALAPTDTTLLRCLGTLRKGYPAELARGAIETVLLRQRARTKFARAEEMFFERLALEQASGETIAAYRARRFFGRVADLCCGLGGDTLALAARGDVLAIDLDPLRLALAQHNVAVYRLRECVKWRQADALTTELANIGGVFVDPDRRPAGKRERAVEACQPPLSALRARLSHDCPLGVKLAPGVPTSDLADLDAEAEFISVAGELKECVLWFGRLRRTRWRATLLPGEHVLCAEAPAESPGVGEVGRYLYDPDPAVLRAGLATDLAWRLGARQLDERIAWLTSDRLEATPFATVYEVEADMPFNHRTLSAWLRARSVGRITVRTRGSAVNPADLTRMLKLSGPESRDVFATRLGDRPRVIIGRSVAHSR